MARTFSPQCRRPASASPLAVRLADDGDRTGRMLDDLVADRAEQEAGEAAVASVANHDQVGVSCLLEQYFGRLPLHRRALTVDPGLQLFRFCNCFLHNGLGAVAETVEGWLVECGNEAAGVDGRWDLPGADDPQPRLPQCGLAGCELERHSGAG